MVGQELRFFEIRFDIHGSMGNADNVNDVGVDHVEHDVRTLAKAAIAKSNLIALTAKQGIVRQPLKSRFQCFLVTENLCFALHFERVIGNLIQVRRRTRRNPIATHLRARVFARFTASFALKQLTNSPRAACLAPAARCSRKTWSRLLRSNSRSAARTTSLANRNARSRSHA